MKKEGLVVFAILLLAGFASSAHIAMTFDGNDSVSIEEGKAYYYNFSVENSGSGGISQVNISLPASLEFRATTEVTDSFFQSFSNTTGTLVWSNFAGDLIGAGEKRYFAFVANATASGSYSITFRTLDSAGTDSSVIFLQVTEAQEEVLCISNWSCSAWSGCANNFQTRTCADLNSCADDSTKPVLDRYCSTENCIQNWSCLDWSECVDGIMTRTCFDLNGCNDIAGKPAETQSCPSGECSSVYSCTDWEPKKCDKNQIQTRTCTDKNNCGTSLNKPEESRECKANSHLFFILLVFVTGSFALFFLILLIIRIKNYLRMKEKKDSGNKQNPPGINKRK